MITKEIEEVATEINVIFQNLSNDILNKIPRSMQEYFKSNASDSYNFAYDKTKTLSEQKLNPKTKGIIAFLYKEYICDDLEKQEYIKEYNKFLDKMEQDKIAFNSNQMFNKSKAEIKFDNPLPASKEKKKWYAKIIKYIKELFS